MRVCLGRVVKATLTQTTRNPPIASIVVVRKLSAPGLGTMVIADHARSASRLNNAETSDRVKRVFIRAERVVFGHDVWNSKDTSALRGSCYREVWRILIFTRHGTPE